MPARQAQDRRAAAAAAAAAAQRGQATSCCIPLQIAQLDASFGWQHPLTFTNWVTTDPLVHPLEPPAPTSYEDWMSVDATHLRTRRSWTAGYFVNFHAYPYYPFFLNLPPADYPSIANLSAHPEIRTPTDPYAAYLEELRAYFADYALIITEVGLPSSYGTAKIGFQGRNHGFLEENNLGAKLRDIVTIIKDRQLDGAILFALHDEWFKRTWNTEIVDWDRQYWHNVLSPEQVFGIIAVEAQAPVYVDGYVDDWLARPNATNVRLYGTLDATDAADAASAAPRQLRGVGIAHDEAYLYVVVQRADAPWETTDHLVLSFDTIPDQGSLTWANLSRVTMGHATDFLLYFADGTLTLYVRSRGHRRSLRSAVANRAPRTMRPLAEGSPTRPPTCTPTCGRRPTTAAPTCRCSTRRPPSL